MFESFSRGYYLGRLYVEPHDGDQAVMQAEQHERLNRQLYADGEGLERLDYPLVVKIGSRHLAVHGSAEVPGDTIAAPPHILEDAGIDAPPELSEVLLAKPERADQLLRITGT
ncbi:MAG: DUF5802 family protein [Halobacteriaceae archaeon]